MTKNEIKEIYRRFDPTDEGKMLKDLESLTEYHGQGTNWKQVNELLKEMPPLAWKMVTPEVQEYMKGLGKEPTKPSTTPAEDRQAANEAIQMATNMAAMEYFNGTLLTQMILGKTRFLEIDKVTNNCMHTVSDRREFAYTLTRAFVLHMVENPVECGTGSTFRVADDKNAEFAVQYVLMRVPTKDFRDITVYSLDPDEIAYHHPEYFPDDTVPFPLMGEWFGRISDPMAAMAWFWGLYAKLYKGRQVPYFRGGAETQKSMYINNLLKVLCGDSYAGISSKNLKGANQFFLSGLENSMVAIIPDCQNSMIYEVEWVKEISGSDPVRIETKGDPTIRTVVLETLLCVISNKRPQFTNQGYARKRALLLEVPDYKDGNPPWVTLDDIKEELPGFLAACKDCWDKLSDEYGFEIAINDKTKQLIREASDRYEGEWITITTKNFVIEEGGQVTGKEVRSILRAETGSRAEFAFDNYREFLDYTFGVTCIAFSGTETLFGMSLKDEAVNKIKKGPAAKNMINGTENAQSKEDQINDLLGKN